MHSFCFFVYSELQLIGLNLNIPPFLGLDVIPYLIRKSGNPEAHWWTLMPKLKSQWGPKMLVCAEPLNDTLIQECAERHTYVWQVRQEQGWEEELVGYMRRQLAKIRKKCVAKPLADSQGLVGELGGIYETAKKCQHHKTTLGLNALLFLSVRVLINIHFSYW